MVLATWAPAAASAQRARSPWTLVTDPTARSVDVDRRTAAWIALADEMPVQLRAAAMPERDDVSHEALRAEALAAYDRVLAAHPDDAATLAATARLREHTNDLAGALRDATRSLALAPEGPDAPAALFTLGVVHTRLGDDAASRDDYLRGLRFPLRDGTRAVVLGNLCDADMALGDLAAAVDACEGSVALRPTYALGWLGLALARDRARLDATAALAQALRSASDASPRGVGRSEADTDALLRELFAEGVFFVPERDRAYHEAMAHEAAATAWTPHGTLGLASEPSRVREHREAARDAWRRYVSAAPANDPWRARAAEHLRALEAP